MQLQVPDTMTATQRRLFSLLWEHEGKVVRHQALLELLGRQDTRESRKLLSAHIGNIRRKISHLPVIINAATRQGYLLREELKKDPQRELLRKL